MITARNHQALEPGVYESDNAGGQQVITEHNSRLVYFAIRKNQIPRDRETESHGSGPKDSRVTLNCKKFKAARLFFCAIVTASTKICEPYCLKGKSLHNGVFHNQLLSYIKIRFINLAPILLAMIGI
jgi:hypothetical protein